MDLKHLLFSFDGRIRRLHWWLGVIGVSVVMGIIEQIALGMTGFQARMAMGDAAPAAPMAGIGWAIFAIAFVVNCWMSFALGAKRCHDRDKTGWFQLIGLIPLIGGIWLLIELGFLDGTPGPNKYGPSPKANASPSIASA